MTQPAGPRGLRPGDELLHTTPLDPLVAPVLADLELEYDTRYGDMFGQPASVEISRYPAAIFSPPNGTFVVLVRDGKAVSAGAFMRIDDSTVEIKRMWTHTDARGQGLARVILTELEAEAARRGYTQVVLSTGPRQPEAVRLYLATGYTPLFDPSLTADEIMFHEFSKNVGSLPSTRPGHRSPPPRQQREPDHQKGEPAVERHADRLTGRGQRGRRDHSDGDRAGKPAHGGRDHVRGCVREADRRSRDDIGGDAAREGR